MASRQAWISNKNVCVLYRVTAAAGRLSEPQLSGLSWNTHSHICTLIQMHVHTELAGLRHLFLLQCHGSSSSSSSRAAGLCSSSGWNTAWAAVMTIHMCALKAIPGYLICVLTSFGVKKARPKRKQQHPFRKKLNIQKKHFIIVHR